MNRQNFVTAITERARQERPVTKTDVAVILTCLGDTLIEDVLLQGEKVSLPRVGRFEAKQTKGSKQFWVFDFSREAEAAVQAHGGEVMP